MKTETAVYLNNEVNSLGGAVHPPNQQLYQFIKMIERLKCSEGSGTPIYKRSLLMTVKSAEEVFMASSTKNELL